MPDETAARFDAYVRGHRQALVRLATLLSGSQQLAEDLVQDVLVRLYPRWDSITETADAHPYVRRSVTNEYLSWRRRWHTRHVRVVSDLVLERVPEDVRPDEQPDPELWARLMALPKQQRAAVVLRYWEGLTDAEIADVLECRAGTVRAHVSRGLAALRTVMSEETS